VQTVHERRSRVNIGGGGARRSVERADLANNADRQINQSIDSYLDRSVHDVVVANDDGNDRIPFVDCSVSASPRLDSSRSR